MTQPDLLLCQDCGAAMLDYDKHRSWHSDIERRIRNVNTNINERLDSIAEALRRCASKAELRKTDDRIDPLWPAIHELRDFVQMPPSQR